ncbi:C-terminal binding protein [Leifsonia naganoensis]|uniref:D-3-phosphoglycerate dehydrogenase n=1 Tax=Leifsonia naganoensis TaxID=150025 RepID=A0A853DXP4_9MICO|nr:C-terminal binding protein [Leifsonia naganoensis]NYK12174.1 D-3-phosphoglycerate dehydrogenase [Leifsonia naganoensis]
MTSDLVVITDCDLPGTAADDALTAAGLRVRRAASPSADDIVAAAADASALIVQWAPITGELLDRLPNLRFISRLGIGYDMIDVEAATERGILVANTPAYCLDEVATHTLAMILTLGRGLVSYDRAVRAGRWSAVDARPMGFRPAATSVAVVGYGRIGSLVARRCAALGFHVVVADPMVPDVDILADGLEPAPLEEAIARADVLTLHAPLTDATRHLVDGAALATMKPTAVIVNTCRGPLVDEEALADALESGRLAGAAIDVFESEPLPASSRLRALDTVLLTPHAAWYSPEALIDLPLHAADNIIDHWAGRAVPAIVNRVAATAD